LSLVRNQLETRLLVVSTFPVPMMFKLDCVVKFLCINLWTFWYGIHSISTLRSNTSVCHTFGVETRNQGLEKIYWYCKRERYTGTSTILKPIKLALILRKRDIICKKPKFIRMIFIDAGTLSLDAGRNHTSCNQCTCLSTEIV
jgi:hypothetical protein